MFKQMAVILIGLMMVTGCSATASAATGNVKMVEGSGMIVKAQRAIGEFHAVRLNGEGHVIVTRGTTTGLTLEADDNFVSLIETSVENGTLVIGLDDAQGPLDLRETQPIRFYVSTPMFDGVEINGAGSVTADNFEAEQVGLTIDGSGEVKLSGATRVLNIGIHGTGHVDASNLRATRTRIEIGGSGAVNAWATGQLDAAISGTGNIQYYGRPTINKVITGLGTLIALGDK